MTLPRVYGFSLAALVSVALWYGIVRAVPLLIERVIQ